MYNQKLRPRRMRISPAMRAMVCENTLSAKDFVYPLFVVPGEQVKEEIPSMPNCYHLSVENAVRLPGNAGNWVFRQLKSLVCQSIKMWTVQVPGI